MNRRRMWRRIKWGNSCSLTFFVGMRQVALSPGKQICTFLGPWRKMQIDNVNVSLINSLLWYFGCPCSTGVSLLMNNPFSKKLLRVEVFIHLWLLKVNNIKERHISLFYNRKPLARKAPVSLLPGFRGFLLQFLQMSISAVLGCTSCQGTT